MTSTDWLLCEQSDFIGSASCALGLSLSVHNLLAEPHSVHSWEDQGGRSGLCFICPGPGTQADSTVCSAVLQPSGGKETSGSNGTHRKGKPDPSTGDGLGWATILVGWATMLDMIKLEHGTLELGFFIQAAPHSTDPLWGSGSSWTGWQEPKVHCLHLLEGIGKDH